MLKRSLARIMAMMSGIGATVGDAIGMDKSVQRGNVAAKRLNKNRGKRSGGRGGIKYRPGYLGVSAVSAAIIKKYGRVMNRQERKRLAKQNGQPFIAFYNKG